MKNNSKYSKTDSKGLQAAFSKSSEISYLPLFQKEVLSDNLVHYEAGILSMSKNFYNLLHNFYSRSPKKKHGQSSLLTNEELIFLQSYSKKAEYYNNLTLKSENTYLKSHISELEDDIQKLYECNCKMVKVNKNLDLKVNFYQKKIHCFTEVYNQIIEHINSIFKKIGTYLLDAPQGNHIHDMRSPKQASDKAKQKLNSLFSQEMADLKSIFKNLQSQIDDLNDDYANTKHLQLSDNHANSYISKILDPSSTINTPLNSETNLKSVSRQNDMMLPSPLSHTGSRKLSKPTEDSTKNAKPFRFEFPSSTKAGNKQSPIKFFENRTPSSHEKAILFEAPSSPSKKNFKSKSGSKDHSPSHQLFKYIPSPKMSLKNEIRKELMEKAANHSRHSSLNHISYFNNSGMLSQRGSTKPATNPHNLGLKGMNSGADYIDARDSSNIKSALNRNSSDQFLINNPTKTHAAKLSNQVRRIERPDSSRSEKSIDKHFGFRSEQLRIEKNDIPSPSYDPILKDSIKEGMDAGNEDGEYCSNGVNLTGRDTYDNLKNFRKLIQNFRIDLSKVTGNTDINIQTTGLSKDISPYKTTKR